MRENHFYKGSGSSTRHVTELRPIARLVVQQVQLPEATDTAIMVAHESMPSLVEWKRIKMSFGGATVSHVHLDAINGIGACKKQLRPR